MSPTTTPKVVVAVDGTPASDGALNFAIVEARRHGCVLHVVHVGPTYIPTAPMLPYTPGDLAGAGRDILRRAANVARAAGDLVVTTALLGGSRTSELVRAAHDSRLLVIGQHSHTGLERLLAGAVTASIAAHADVPVTVVPATWTAGDRHGMVAAGLKTEAKAEVVLAAAFAAASERHARLRVVHAWHLPSPYADRIEQRTHEADWIASGTERLQALLTDWYAAYPEVAVEIDIVHDVPARALVRVADEADLLILVRHPPRVLLGHHLGATARVVVAESTAPVQVVPPESLNAATASRDRAESTE